MRSIKFNSVVARIFALIVALPVLAMPVVGEISDTPPENLAGLSIGAELGLTSDALASLTTPNLPDKDNISISSAEETDDDPTPHSNLDHHSPLTFVKIHSVPLPPDPATIGGAYRITHVYRITRRIRA